MMPSEKSRYMNRNSQPAPPFDFLNVRERVSSLGVTRLAELVWTRSENDSVLAKIMMVTLALEGTDGDIDFAKRAIDYGLYFPEYVRYTEGGHGQILYEIKGSLQHLADSGHNDLALRLARHTIERAQEVSENFEDDWDWTSSIDDLRNWADKMAKD